MVLWLYWQLLPLPSLNNLWIHGSDFLYGTVQFGRLSVHLTFLNERCWLPKIPISPVVQTGAHVGVGPNIRVGLMWGFQCFVSPLARTLDFKVDQTLHTIPAVKTGEPCVVPPTCDPFSFVRWGSIGHPVIVLRVYLCIGVGVQMV